ncbi:MAG: hypothetical protein Q4D60_11020 [Eubacteriales bacterium]|nr:hypothetical protein [Eubacteriales bacterium]
MIILNVPYEKRSADKQTRQEAAIIQGVWKLNAHSLFGNLNAQVFFKNGRFDTGKGMAVSSYQARIYVNHQIMLSPAEWMRVIAHCMMHTYFGHFDREKLPEGANTNMKIWNKACDLYVEQFLDDVNVGLPLIERPSKKYPFKMDDEQKIYNKLLECGDAGNIQDYGTAGVNQMDMLGIHRPVSYKNGQENPYTIFFGNVLSDLAKRAVSGTVSNEKGMIETEISKASRWFLSHYPLLGSLAASFRIVSDYKECMIKEVKCAAVDIGNGTIYANPICSFSEEEWRFVLAHEFLHAGLQHHVRCKGRHPFIWNLAADFVINGWLKEMDIGKMPSGCLYDEAYKGMSAESVYDLLIQDARRSFRLQTFRGYHRGDLFGSMVYSPADIGDSLAMDEFYRNALSQGLVYHESYGRGTVPAGLIQEIRALQVPPIHWKVKLAEWFYTHFPMKEKQRSYARPSRRQSATPDIPRPGYIEKSTSRENHTFGVIIDTSGSMTPENIGKALGAVASYAVSRDVPFVRVVFCDAGAYDNGYMAPEDIAGTVQVKGRGGTLLQPAVDLLRDAADFPKKAPILIITDGMIEEKISIQRDHAWILPKRGRLPFATKKPVFWFE